MVQYFCDIFYHSMRRNILLYLLIATFFVSCGEYNKVIKNPDHNVRYEAAKKYFANKKYSKAAFLLNDLIIVYKDTERAEESLYMLGMCYYNDKDYQTAAQTFVTYANSYPRGSFAEMARFYAGKALYLDSPEERLDQSATYKAMQLLQVFLETHPKSENKLEAEDMIFSLQDKLVLKELYSAKLYYNLGNYGGNNYLSCVITAQNALKEYPYTVHREELSILILRAKYEMAFNSVEEKKEERYRETIDEYYSFVNEFPESKYLREAEKIFKASSKVIKE